MAPMSSKLSAWAFHSTYLPMATVVAGCSGSDSLTTTIRRRPRNGSGRSSTAFTTVKMAAQAPIPRPRVSTTTAVKPGVRANRRKA